ncbi:MAG: ATP-binding protein, partial [Prevotellaceae bacterium]|nr:ATP-binding protein [Prevotellaceae bacterium]
MIIEFTVGNFLSCHGKRTISFEAKNVSELKQNVIRLDKYKLLRSIVIYGANSSGKSNIIKAFERMRDCVRLSVKLNDSDKLDYSPFLLSEESMNKPTFFEIVFLNKAQRFRYGFEYNQTEIVSEWLFTGKSHKGEKPLFIRTAEGIGVSDYFAEGKGKEESTNENRLFLSLAAQLGGEISKQVMECFRNYNVLSGIEHGSYGSFSLHMFHKHLTGCDESLSLFQKLQLGFNGIQTIESEFKPADLPESMSVDLKSKLVKKLSGEKTVSLNTTHHKYDKKGNIAGTVSWISGEHESEGTKKIMDLSGPVFDTLLNGKTLIVDELDTKLHPLITMQIINLFNSPTTNANNAQLLFATHDTNLLNTDFFRRDQIWFTEKDKMEQTDLYSLYDFVLPDGSRVRNDANLEKNYIRGRYGAIP